LKFYRKKSKKKSTESRRTPKRVIKEIKKKLNHEIEVFTSIKITNERNNVSNKHKNVGMEKNSDSILNPSQGERWVQQNKSNSKSPSKKQTTPKKSPPKKMVQKNIKESSTMSRRVKRQKVTNTSIQIKIEEKAKINEKNLKKEDLREEKKQKIPQKVQQKKIQKMETQRNTPKKNKRVLKEEAKKEDSNLNSCKIKSPKYVNPFEIRKMIETSVLTKETIVKSIEFPSCQGGVKVIQHVREISISTIKKIQSTIQRIKATERRLKDIQVKTKESLKRKGINLEAKKSSHSKKYEGEYEINLNLTRAQISVCFVQLELLKRVKYLKIDRKSLNFEFETY
jgi:hypothetical protein